MEIDETSRIKILNLLIDVRKEIVKQDRCKEFVPWINEAIEILGNLKHVNLADGQPRQAEWHENIWIILAVVELIVNFFSNKDN